MGIKVNLISAKNAIITKQKKPKRKDDSGHFNGI